MAGKTKSAKEFDRTARNQRKIRGCGGRYTDHIEVLLLLVVQFEGLEMRTGEAGWGGPVGGQD
jgi:hypothetical protein